MNETHLPEARANLKPVETDAAYAYATPLERMYDELHRAGEFLHDMVERVKACAETLEECVDELYESRVYLSSDVPKAWQRAEKQLSQFIAELEGAAERMSA